MPNKSLNTQNALLSSDETCPECGGQLVIRHVGKSSFWGCQHYPTCRYTKSTHEESDFEPQLIPEPTCPVCASALALKKGRYGFFVGCMAFPTCKFVTDPASLNASQGVVQCPSCQEGLLTHRTSRYGSAFYGCDQYPKCRYIVNDRPVSQVCPECQWPILLQVDSQLRCPQKDCHYCEQVSE